MVGRTWWQGPEAGNHFISELRKQRENSRWGYVDFLLPSLRLHLLKAPHPFQTAPAAGDQVLRHLGDISHSNVKSMLIKKKEKKKPPGAPFPFPPGEGAVSIGLCDFGHGRVALIRQGSVRTLICPLSVHGINNSYNKLLYKGKTCFSVTLRPQTFLSLRWSPPQPLPCLFWVGSIQGRAAVSAL